MKILFTGATGVLGRAAVPRLVEDGHDVIAVSRSPEDAAWLEGMGANIGALSFEVGEGLVVAVHAVLNPDKLAHLTETLHA